VIREVVQSERAFQASVVRYAELMGWAVFHPYDSRRSQVGFPDLVMVRRPRIVWAELKAQRGRLTDAQRAWIEELRACGQAAVVWRPSDWQEIEDVLR
jgi:VRR-NUC domain